MRKHVDARGAKNKVEVNADFITGSDGERQMTPAAGTRAKAGHDVMTFFSWDVRNDANFQTRPSPGYGWRAERPQCPVEGRAPKRDRFNYPLRPASGQKPCLTASEAAPEGACGYTIAASITR
jgi:hypothetical protein